MLHELKIENIAVIQKADIVFQEGLNVLTGETGAGKSIIVDSLAAITGSRVSRELIRTGAERATVTAVFDSDSASKWLSDNDIDHDDENLIVQRRISLDGKNSCRVNGFPVTVSQLKSLGSFLLEIHGQNDGLQLLDERNHLSSLDRFAMLDMSSYQSEYQHLQFLRSERDRLTMDEIEKEHLHHVLSETVRELENADIQENEQDELSTRRDLLRHAEKLTEALHVARESLSADQGAISEINNAAWQCHRVASYSSDMDEIGDKLDQAALLVSDADEFLRDFEESLNFSEEEYDRIEQRLHELSRLERKYRKSLEELPDYLEDCRKRLDEISFSEERIMRLDKEIKIQIGKCTNLAEKLHQKRCEAAKLLETQIENELKDLSMPSARFHVDVICDTDFNATGMDTVRFLLAANRGETPGRISRIASGGELSRIMLAMKNVLSRGDPVPTMIFDEIDTGVSGIAAQRVGEKLAELSVRKQVLCVTHLPQLASMADYHFAISKSESGERTMTEVHLLDHDGKCRELARLHGGDNITVTTLRSAEEQLQHAECYKNNMKEKENGRV